MENVRLFISIASNRPWVGRFGMAYGALISHLTGKVKSRIGDKYFLETFIANGLGQASCLSATRQFLLDDMVNRGFTHWLALDDDMTFPADIADRLILHDADVAATNARLKNPQVTGALIDANGIRLSSFGKTGTENISRFGGAVFLARIDSFKDIPKPHFEVKWIDKDQGYMDCDYYFSSLLHQRGLKMICDHDSSQLIGHVGDHEYTWPEPASQTPPQA